MESLDKVAPPSNVTSDITKFFRPIPKNKAPKLSHFFSSPSKPTIPSSPPLPPSKRNFDAEVGDLPDEVFDWPELQTGTQPQPTPPQTVPQSPLPAPQPATLPSHQSSTHTPNQTVPDISTSPSTTPQATQDSTQPTSLQPQKKGTQLKGGKCKRKLDFEPVPDAKKLHC